jgi:hypothetical protein
MVELKTAMSSRELLEEGGSGDRQGAAEGRSGQGLLNTCRPRVVMTCQAETLFFRFRSGQARQILLYSRICVLPRTPHCLQHALRNRKFVTASPDDP